MIKDVMFRLDGSPADELRLAVVNDIAERFGSHVTGLYFNILPIYLAEEGDSAGARRSVELIERARAAGDATVEALRERLARLQKPMELRRFNVMGDSVPEIATQLARTADAFVAMRPDGARTEPEQLIESVLFGAGRHLILVPEGRKAGGLFDHVLLAWNGRRESARALAEALPYFTKAKAVTVVVVDDQPDMAESLGREAVKHLQHHGVRATLNRVKNDGGVGATLIEEATRIGADVIAMGGYGHSRLREWLLGGATYHIMHHAPMPVMLAH